MIYASSGIIVAMGLSLAPAFSEDLAIPPPPDPLAEIDAENGTSLAQRSEVIRRLVDESISLGKRLKRLKDDPAGTAAARARLKELQSELAHLVNEQMDELIDLDPANAIDGTTDPSEIYFQGWLLSRDAGKLKEQGDITGCRLRLNAAMRYFERVSRLFPDWKPAMVGGRLEATKEALSAIAPWEE